MGQVGQVGRGGRTLHVHSDQASLETAASWISVEEAASEIFKGLWISEADV